LWRAVDDNNEWALHLALDGHAGCVNALTVLPDGRMASGSDDRSVRVWDAWTGACLATLAHSTWVSLLAVLPSGELVSAGDEGQLRVWA
jgi:WD40 repeat protein